MALHCFQMSSNTFPLDVILQIQEGWGRFSGNSVAETAGRPFVLYFCALSRFNSLSPPFSP